MKALNFKRRELIAHSAPSSPIGVAKTVSAPFGFYFSDLCSAVTQI